MRVSFDLGTRVVISFPSSKKVKRHNLVSLTHLGTGELVLSTEKPSIKIGVDESIFSLK